MCANKTKSQNIFQSLLQHQWDFVNEASEDPIFSIHPYPAKFIPNIPENLIKDLGVSENSLVCDPFCGSGTTLLAAQKKGCSSVGIDLNPIACLISKVATRSCPRDLSERANQCIDLAMNTDEKIAFNHIPNIDHWFKKDVQLAIARLVWQIREIRDESLKEVFETALSSIIVRVSNQESDTRYAAIEKKVRSFDVYELFRKTCERYSHVLRPADSILPEATVLNKDILTVTKEDFPGPIGLVICSPPYPNAYEYWLYHKYRMWWLGFDPMIVKKSEIGARPHFFKKNPQGPEDFKRQMVQVFGLLSEVCKPDAHVCFILGDSKIHGKIIDNAKLLIEAAFSRGFEIKAVIPRSIPSSRKSFNLSHARIMKENILVFKKKEREQESVEVTLFWHKYRYFPYEKRFALREIAAISGIDSLVIEDDRVKLRVNDPKSEEFSRLVYFAKFEAHNLPQESTKQYLIERTASLNGNGKKQSTRYSVHGLHDFKGRFNPQIVRGILNWFSLPEQSNIIDPFLGSGTTIIESVFAGHRAYGWDLNPFAVYMTNAKLQALKVQPSTLKRLAEEIVKRMQTAGEDAERDGPRYAYLRKWFPEKTLIQIEIARIVIDDIAGELGPIFKTVMSNLLREYSLQEPSDLRIRRRKSPLPSTSLLSRYETELRKLLHSLECSYEVYPNLNPTAAAIQADGRCYDEVISKLPSHFGADFAFTSPPYATALPYVDTQRLSLVWLDLIPAGSILQAERSLIGSREASTVEIANLKNDILHNSSKLPREIADLCSRLQNLVSDRDGFRRQAVPALLYRYFSDMEKTFGTVQRIVRNGGYYVLIVGVNETTLGGKREIIDTPYFLTDIAKATGWNFVERLDLETYKRFGLNVANSIKNESLLVFEK